MFNKMKKIKLIVNGTNKTFVCSNELLLLNVMNIYKGKNVAVAINNKIIKKRNWITTKLNESDRIEIVTPFPGG